MRRVQGFEQDLDGIDIQDLRVLMTTFWAALRGPTFHAWLELAIASRTHPPLAEELHALMKRFDTLVMALVENRIPKGLFGPFDLKLVVGIGFSAFNGLALDRLQMTDTEVEAKVASLIEMLVLLVDKAGREN